MTCASGRKRSVGGTRYARKIPTPRKLLPGQGVADEDAAEERQRRGEGRHDQGVLHPVGERRVLEEVPVVLQREVLDPEGGVLHLEEVVRGLQRDDRHPVEREEQEDQVRAQGQVEGQDLATKPTAADHASPPSGGTGAAGRRRTPGWGTCRARSTPPSRSRSPPARSGKRRCRRCASGSPARPSSGRRSAGSRRT